MKFSNQEFEKAAKRIKKVIKKIPLEFSLRLSKKYKSQIYFKREDLQMVRSFKIRGAFNKISYLFAKEKRLGIVTASAGNHAQGVAFACAHLKIKGKIFMPIVTPQQKIERVKYFGRNFVNIELKGESFDETEKEARKFAKVNKKAYIHPFNDPWVILGQGTIGKEIFDELGKNLNYILVPVGGGGLIAGIATYLKQKNKNIKVIGVEAEGQEGMYLSLKRKKVIPLKKVNTFIEGTAVKKVGKLTFKLCKKFIDKIVVVPEGKVAETIIDLYQNEGIITEPAGALAIAALDFIAQEIKNKTVVGVISGGNNDILRYPEILEKSLVYQGKKYYFLIEFTQKPGQLKKFVNYVLGPNDDIVLFEYIKKNNKEKGPALVGIELKRKEDLHAILKKLKISGFNYKLINDKELLYSYLV